jgi:drug/metabolite transporter (DMT)-like permease
MSNLALYLITISAWGSSWLAINYQLGVVATEVSVVYRYALAATLLFAWIVFKRLPLVFNVQAHLRFFLLGLLLFSLNYIATYTAQHYISSALNAIAFSTMMWMNVINSRIFFGTRIETKVYLGAALGMAGIIVLFWPQVSSISLDDRTLIGAGLSLSGAFVASLGNMVSQSSQKIKLPVLQSNAWGMFYGTIITGLIALGQGREFNFDFSAGYVTSLFYLAIFASIIAFGSYLKLLGRIGAHKAGYVVVMFPVVALVLSLLFEGLTFEINILLGVALVIAGNLVILGVKEASLAIRKIFQRRYLRPFGLRLAFRTNAVRYMASLLSHPDKKS